MSKTIRLTCLLAVLTPASSFAAELPAAGEYRHMGVATCATSQCHGSAVPRDGGNVLQNEYVTWTQDDPHSKAWQTLAGDASRAIAARLGLESAATADICLDCHADNVPAAARGDRFQISDGVGCEACHGGAGEWLATHDDLPAVDHAANLAAGMYPAAEPAARARLCLSCHLGTKDKFATHRIMAAGHPRLAFELDTFTELWRTAGRQPHYRVDPDYRERKPVYGHAFTWATGVIAEARQRMALVADRGFDTGTLFPELGLYDCHACHRSMKTVAWRRLPRHGDAPPGMPFLNDGALVMALALARAVDTPLAAGIETALAELHEASGRNPAAVRAAAASIEELLRRLDGRITPAALSGRERMLLRELLATGAEGNYLDYASAEQAFMAVQLLAFDIGDPALIERLDPLGDALLDDERYRPRRFAALLEALRD